MYSYSVSVAILDRFRKISAVYDLEDEQQNTTLTYSRYQVKGRKGRATVRGAAVFSPNISHLHFPLAYYTSATAELYTQQPLDPINALSPLDIPTESLGVCTRMCLR